jgi:hypothetical protein
MMGGRGRAQSLNANTNSKAQVGGTYFRGSRLYGRPWLIGQ